MNLILALALVSQVSKVGVASSTFLTLDYDAASSGLGSAFVAVANSPFTALSNPAGVANFKDENIVVGASVMKWMEIGEFPALSLIKPMGYAGNLGVYLQSVIIGGMKEAKVTPSGIKYTNKDLSYSAFLLGFTYAKYYTDKFATGIGIKIFRENYGGYTSVTDFALDVGSFYWTGFKSLRIALVMQNLGPDSKPSGDYYLYTLGQGGAVDSIKKEFSGHPLPMIFRMGLAMEVIENPNYTLTLSVEAIHPTDYYEGISIGSELKLMGMVVLRAGYSFNQGEKTFGAGLGVKAGAIGLDYSYTNMNTLPGKHRIQIYYAR